MHRQKKILKDRAVHVTLSQQVTKNIIKRLLRGEDYRVEIVGLINAEFLQFAVDFFKEIVDAKLKNKSITFDWYRQTFLDPSLPAQEIAINAGLNKKTIHNMFNSSKKEIVIDASNEHYDRLYSAIRHLVESEGDLELNLTIKFKGVSVELNISESLIVINTLAVKRSELRGGLWSTAGKRVEKPLMQTLCELHGVSQECYSLRIPSKQAKGVNFKREIDFYLQTGNTLHKCEVKLMGRGNPEGADAVIARDSRVFIADKLSDTNKRQLDSLGIHWVELRSAGGFRKFATVLDALGIPYRPLAEYEDQLLDDILKRIF